jgi:transposase-like protein
LQYPSDVVALVVLWRLRYKLSLRDLAEMFLITPALAENLRRRRRRGKVGRSWYVDETYVKIQGRWCYLYRAIDTSGALVDVRLSETRDMAAARAFFRSAKTVTGITPARVTTDGHDSYPKAIRTELGEEVRHRTNCYLNNRIEQDHRGIKGRYQPMQILESLLGVANAGPAAAADLIRAELESAFLASLLCAARHNYSDLLDRGGPAAAPWQVRRAESFIEANWDAPITLEDIVSATGASARSVFRAFRQSRGYTPLQFKKACPVAACKTLVAGRELNAQRDRYCFDLRFS